MEKDLWACNARVVGHITPQAIGNLTAALAGYRLTQRFTGVDSAPGWGMEEHLCAGNTRAAGQILQQLCGCKAACSWCRLTQRFTDVDSASARVANGGALVGWQHAGGRANHATGSAGTQAGVRRRWLGDSHHVYEAGGGRCAAHRADDGGAPIRLTCDWGYMQRTTNSWAGAAGQSTAICIA